MTAYLSACLMDAYLSACLMPADLKALVLDGSLLDGYVAAALQFIAKSACLYAIERGDFQFNQSYFDCN